MSGWSQLCQDVNVLQQRCPWTKSTSAYDSLFHLRAEVHEVESLLRKHASARCTESSALHSSIDASAPNSAGEYMHSASQVGTSCQSELFRKQNGDSARQLRSELADELGDVLFNALLLVSICARDHASGLTLDECAAAACAKLRRRAPYVDGDCAPANVAEAQELWQAGKAKERREAQATPAAECSTTAREQVHSVLVHEMRRADTPVQREAPPAAPVGPAAPRNTTSSEVNTQHEHAHVIQNAAPVHGEPRGEAPSLPQDAPESVAQHASRSGVKAAAAGTALATHAADTDGAVESASAFIESSVAAIDLADCSGSSSDHGLSDWARDFAWEEPEPSDDDESE